MEAILKLWAKCDRKAHNERAILATQFYAMLKIGGERPARIRHKCDPITARSYAVTGLYSRGVLSYFLVGEGMCLVNEYEVVS